jgi:hypothetical protein
MKPAATSSNALPPPPWLYRVAARVLGPLEKMLGITCRDFVELSSEKHECALSTGKNIRYFLHRLICAICRKQERRMEHLDQLAGDVICKEGCDHAIKLGPEARERIRENVALEIGRKDSGSN